MKFETKLTKLEIDENEVKNIIANCECGEINGAYFIDLTKEKKEFIMEVIGNYFNMEERNDHVEETEWTDIKRIATFCKTFDISEDEIPYYYRLGFNEGGCDIAYELESNKDVLLVLTDDERYTNSFIKYSPSQQTEEESEETENSYKELFNTIKQAETELHNTNNYSIREKTEDDKGYIVDLNILDELILYHSLVKGEVINDKAEICRILKSHTKIINESVIKRIADDIDLKYVIIEFKKQFKKEPANIGYDEKTGIQYQIMTEENKNAEGKYIPSFDKLFREAPTGAMAMEWNDCQRRMAKRPFKFQGFAFNLVVLVKQKCGHYEILQHPYHDEYDDLNKILTDFAEENRRCTRCICG